MKLQKIMTGTVLLLIAFSVEAGRADDADKQALETAMAECASETGVTLPEPGSQKGPPSEEDKVNHAKIKKCLEGKNVKMPRHSHKGRHHGAPPAAEKE